MSPCIVAFACFIAASAWAADVSPQIEAIRAKHAVPALAAAAIQHERLLASGVSGWRAMGGKQRVRIEDKWHLGSCTKSMTASLAAILVERGVVRWETTVSTALPKMPMQEAWRGVTLEQLLTHRAGAPAEPPAALWKRAWQRIGSPREQRAAFVSGLLATAPAPGAKFVYSNQGYSIAGAMLEEVQNLDWESLLRRELFAPLQLASAGFGSPGEGHPHGHRGGLPMLVGDLADNPPAIGPGGTVHMSIRDFAAYAGWHAARAGLLKPASFERLHTPKVGSEYALVFFSTRRGWGGTVIMHTGSNTMNFAVMWIAPEKGIAVVAACNAAGPEASAACDAACALLIEQFQIKSRPSLEKGAKNL